MKRYLYFILSSSSKLSILLKIYDQLQSMNFIANCERSIDVQQVGFEKKNPFSQDDEDDLRKVFLKISIQHPHYNRSVDSA